MSKHPCYSKYTLFYIKNDNNLKIFGTLRQVDSKIQYDNAWTLNDFNKLRQTAGSIKIEKNIKIMIESNFRVLEFSKDEFEKLINATFQPRLSNHKDIHHLSDFLFAGLERWPSG